MKDERGHIVTILILLEIILQHEDKSIIEIEREMLQSLFYWKSFCNLSVR